MKYTAIFAFGLMMMSVARAGAPMRIFDVSRLTVQHDENVTPLKENPGMTAYGLAWDTRRWVREQTQQGNAQRSPAWAALFSAAVPGAGEAYAGSYWKAAAFMVAEALFVAGYITYQNRGDVKDRDMRALADSRWDEGRYWSKVYMLAVQNGKWDGPSLQTDAIGRLSDADVAANLDKLRYWETHGGFIGFTHELPHTKTQQYYEMIYKYLIQFGSGWVELGDNWTYYDDPASLNHLTNDVARYKTIRNQSNDFYHTATTISWVILLNHLSSAVDAAFTARAFNHSVEARLEGQTRYYAGETLPMYGLRINW
ncbi:MAG: hypothetical protein D6677_10200 [Calditrichaeota bacterium]|nr:MAG: hypothetical protein D6677_10200 [Calditrichota bacterium]